MFMQAFYFYELFFGFIAYCLNLLVLYLILTRSKKFAKHYRRILLLSCIVDLLFTTVNFLTMEIPEITEDKIFMITNSFLPGSWAIHGSVIWIFALYMTVVNVPMQFLTRYSVVCHSVPYTSVQYCAIYLFGTLYVAVHASLMYITFDYKGHSTRMDEYEQLLRQNLMFAEVDDLKFTVGDASNFGTAVHFINALLIMTTAYTVVAYTGWKIWHTLAGKRHLMSKSTLNAHENLTKILILQAAYPFATVALPLFVANFLPVLKIQTMYLGFVMDLVGTLIPTLDAISVLLIIPSYRRYLFGLFRASTTRLPNVPSDSQMISQLPVTKNDVQKIPEMHQINKTYHRFLK